MSIYQFLIAVRQKDGEMLTNDAGETTRYVIYVGEYVENALTLQEQSSHGLLLSNYTNGRERHQASVCLRREATRAKGRSGMCIWVQLGGTIHSVVQQLSKRFEKREEAKEEQEEAKETGAFRAAHMYTYPFNKSSGTTEDMDRFSRRQVKVTREHNEECRRLLGLMGIPFVVVCISSVLHSTEAEIAYQGSFRS